MQLGGDDLLDGLERKRLDGVLQPRERTQRVGRQQVRSRGQQLPHFDERGTELLEIVREVLAGNGRGRDPGIEDEIGASVLQQQRRDVAVAAQVVQLE